MGATKNELYMPYVERYIAENGCSPDDHDEPVLPCEFDPDRKGWLTTLEQAPF